MANLLLIKLFSSTLIKIKAAENWVAEMNADFGKDELSYSRQKAEDDLAQLEQEGIHFTPCSTS